jgi:GTPase
MLPDFALLLVGANMGVQLMTKEHISIACALSIPLAVVLTKIDIAPQVPDQAACRLNKSPLAYIRFPHVSMKEEKTPVCRVTAGAGC